MVLRSLRVSALLAGAALLSSCSLFGDAEDDNKVAISVNSWVGFGPLYIAKEKGFFDGIDVEINRIDDSAARRADLARGGTQILGSTVDDLAVINLAASPSVAIGCADYSNGADAIMGAGEIQTIEDLATAKVAVDRGFVNHFFLLYVLKDKGLPTDQFEIIQMKPDDAGVAFENGQIDAAVTWEPHITNAIAKRGVMKPGKDKKELPVEIRSGEADGYPEAIVDLFVATQSWSESNPEAVAAFREGWDEALAFLSDETTKDEAIKIMADNLAMEPELVNEIVSGIKFLNTESCKADIGPKWQKLSSAAVELWKEAGLLAGDVDLSDSFRLD